MAVQKVRDLMTAHPVCCTPEESVAAAARQMAAHDCGAVPVVRDARTRRLVGILTDRDIVLRTTARDLSPESVLIGQVMSRNVVFVDPEATVTDCAHLMAERQVRRMPVVDRHRVVLGIVAQADLARASGREPVLEHELARVVEDVSEPNPPALTGVIRA
jgi:CBS domain-containing protein